MLKNSKKKGFIRILEAGLAAILLLGFVSLVTLPNYVRQTNLEDEVFKAVNLVLDEIERNEGLRNSVLNEDEGAIDSFIKVELEKKQINARSSICDIGSFCAIPEGVPADKDVFVRDRIITKEVVNLPEGDVLIAKKIAIHAWTNF